MYISIVKVENNRVTKYASFETDEEAAQYHVKKYGGFVYSGDIPIPLMWVDQEQVSQVALPPKPVTYSVSDFYDRFTKDERKGIRQAAKNNDDIEEWLQRLLMKQIVDPLTPKVIEGMQAMVTNGSLEQSRADEILGIVTLE